MQISREEFYFFGVIVAVGSAVLSWFLNNITEWFGRRHEEQLAIQEALRKHDIERLEEVEKLLTVLRRNLKDNVSLDELAEFISEVTLLITMVSPNLAVSEDLERAIAQLYVDASDLIAVKDPTLKPIITDESEIRSRLRRAEENVNRQVIYLLGTYRRQILGGKRRKRIPEHRRLETWLFYFRRQIGRLKMQYIRTKNRT